MGWHGMNRLGIGIAASGLFLGVLAAPVLRGDEPSRLGRLFRLGGSSRPSDSAAVGKPATPRSDGSYRTPSTSAPLSSPPAFSPSGSLAGTPGTPSSGNRIVPQPRVTKAATEADPMVTRVAIGRSDDGKQFCMFMQVFADGTVLDSEGIHHVGADSLRPIAQVIQSGELDKVARYCGGPAADFIEQVQVVTYDRYRGRLRATSFSYSGNPQGCDPAVKHLNAALDALQTKLAGPPVTAPEGSAGGAAAPRATASDASAPLPPTTPTGSNPIGLTPES